MPPVGFEPTFSAGEQLQTYALDRAATVTGIPHNHTKLKHHSLMPKYTSRWDEGGPSNCITTNRTHTNSCLVSRRGYYLSYRILKCTIIIIFWYISNKMQRYTVYLFLENCSTCLGWYLYPSSGAHATVSAASGTCQTVIATRRYRGGVGTLTVCVRTGPSGT